MRALLDTHVWLWMLTQPERLGASRGPIEDSGNELLLSAASSWEITIKYALGKLRLPAPPATYVPERMRSTGVTPVPVDHLHALAVVDLPPLHHDPFDRMLIAQARLLDVPLLTADPQIEAYDVATIHVG